MYPCSKDFIGPEDSDKKVMHIQRLENEQDCESLRISTIDSRKTMYLF